MSFLRRTGNVGRVKLKFKWPTPVGEVWVNHSDILGKINEPQKVGRSGRCLDIQEDEIEYINGKMNLANNH